MAARRKRVRLPGYAHGLLDRPERYLVLYGGRGGTKSTTAALSILRRCKEVPGYTVAVVREFRVSLQDGAIALLWDWANRMGFRCSKPPQSSRIDFPNGSRIFALGAERNRNNLRGVETADLVWLEEADAISRTSLELLDPSMRRAGAKLLITFNPVMEEDAVYSMFVLPKPAPANCWRHKVNYGDWEPGMTAELTAAREWTRVSNPAAYAHIWEGELRSLVGRVFDASKVPAAAEWSDSERLVRAWDMAGTAGGGDFTVGLLLAKRGESYQIQDVQRGQWGSDEVLHRVKAQAAADGQRCQIVIEKPVSDAAGHIARMWHRELAGYPLLMVPPMGSKTARAYPSAAALNAGIVSRVSGAEWWPALSAELAVFSEDASERKGRHDDQVDALAYAFAQLTGVVQRDTYFA